MVQVIDLYILKKRVGSSLCTDGGAWSVSGDDGDLVGEGEEAVVNGGEELVGIASGEVGAAD